MNGTIPEFKIADLNNSEPDLTYIIESEYDLGKVLEIKKCALGDTNRNFLIKCEKDGITTGYFAKIYGVYKTLDKLIYESEFQLYFNGRACSEMKCALPIETRAGDIVLYMNCESVGRKQFFMVFEFLPGQTLDEEKWRCIMVDKYLERFPKALGKFHRYAYGFKPKEDKYPTDFSTDLQANIKSLANASVLKNDSKSSDYYDFLEPHRDRIMEILIREKDHFEKLKEKLPLCMCHCDTSPNNFRFDDDLNPVAVCDLDWSKEYPRIYDVAWMIQEVLDEFNPETNLTTFDIERIIKFIEDYNAEVSKDPEFAIGKLTQAELSMLPGMIQIMTIKALVCDRLGYMLEHNERLGTSEDNIGVTFYGLSSIDFIEENYEQICRALSEHNF